MKAMEKVTVYMFVVFVFLQCKCDGAGDGSLISPIKTIKTSSGDTYDCVDIYKQPALLNPSLKDHKILMKPNVLFMDFPEEEDSKENEIVLRIEIEGGGCPQGTVPIRRVPDINNITTSVTPHQDALPMDEQKYTELYSVRRAKTRHYYGASSKINAYGVHPIGYDQESSAMIWVKNEEVSPPEDIPIIQAGWSVYPELHRDYKTRLTAAWSRTAGRITCYNYQCHGFVQVNRKLTLGADVWPLSSWFGPQYYLHTHIYQDDKKNWWLAIGDVGNVVGYFPAELFGNFDHASTVDFGGFVRCKKGEDCPPMGNGHRPYTSLWEHVCMMSDVQVIGPDHIWGGLGKSKQYIYFTIPKCYGVGLYFKDSVHGYRFPFGGPVCLASLVPPLT